MIHSDSFSWIVLLSVYHFIPTLNFPNPGPLWFNFFKKSALWNTYLIGIGIFWVIYFKKLQAGVNMEERRKKAKWLQYHIISRAETTEMDEMRKRNRKSKWPFCRIYTLFQPQTWTQLLRISSSSSSRASLRFYMGRLLFLFGSHLCK